ncbi:MAG: quinone oxidoreductase [Pseudomonadota bacterium]
MMLTRAQITAHGGPEVIAWVEEDIPSPGEGEVLIEHTAIGLNFIDTYHRSGLYPIAMPNGLGLEATGRVTGLGAGVTDFALGERVAYLGPALGAYATHRMMPADSLFKVPDGVSDNVAAAAILKAATTEAFVERCAQVADGDTVLVHAAAGGVGLIMAQWLKAKGARVIGTVSTRDKAELAREAGCDEIILYGEEDTPARVREMTAGAGVPTVFDGVGADTFHASLDCLRPRGLLVSFGNASGAVDGVNLGILAQKGSLFVTRPTLFHYYATPNERAAGMARVWEMIETGKVRVNIGQTYALKDAAKAHADLEARATTGSTVLIP